MLFTCLQSEHESTLATVILCHTYNASRHFSNQLLSTTQISHVWATPLHGYAKALSITDSNIGSPFTWCLKYCDIGCYAIHDEQCFPFVTCISNARAVFHDSIHIRLLYHYTGYTVECRELSVKSINISHTIFQGDCYQFDAMMKSVSVKNFTSLGVHSARH